jgi:hypothetical protein
MKKKLVALLAAALMTVSFAGNAMAAFVQGDLIRVVYDTVGSREYATDLGSWATLTANATTGNVTVGGGADAFTLANTGAASLSNLMVGYFLVDNAVLNRAAVSGGTTAPTTGATLFSGYLANAGNLFANYQTNGQAVSGTTNSVYLLDKAAVGTKTYFMNMDGSGASPGKFGGWINSANPSGTLNLAALSTVGYVDQTIYQWTGANLGGNRATLAGTSAFTVRSMADGSTIINPGAVVPPAVPVPPAFFLMGSGLLGMFGIRRKKNA